MFVGHIGAGLALASAQRRINPGWLVGAALLSDLLLWVFLLLGWETGRVPPGASHGHQMVYDFAWSHGLLASLGWALLVGALTAAFTPPPWRWPAAGVMALALLSHWLLDLLVHLPQLPLAGPDSLHVGLGLWQHMGWAIVLELAIAAAGLWLFLRGSGLPRGRQRALAALCALLALFTVAGLLWAPPPPSVVSLALMSFFTQAAVCAAVGWIGRSRH